MPQLAAAPVSHTTKKGQEVSSPTRSSWKPVALCGRLERNLGGALVAAPSLALTDEPSGLARAIRSRWQIL